MERGRQKPEELLLDWHLDRLEEEDRSWVEAELRRDAELRVKSDRLGKILRPLDHWTVPPAPSNLADKVLRHVERSTKGEAVSMTPVGHDQPGSGRPFFLSLRELVAVAAAIVLMMGLLVPGLSGVRSRSQRAVCAGNLGAIYEGTRLYQNTFAGSLPFAGSVSRASWLPHGAKDRPYASNSRHVYLLLKLDYGLQPERFICPASKTAEVMSVDDPTAYDDFASARNIGYDSLNLAGETPNLRPPMPIAYMSDANPLFENGRFNASVDPNKANSPAHNHGGQEVLTLDGRVTWETSPIYGVGSDNLWLAGDLRHYTGTETQTRQDDAFLIPGYPAAKSEAPARTND